MLYTLVHINEIVAAESISPLNHFCAWTVTVGQSEISPIVNWCVDDCLPHSFEPSSLLEEGSSSLNNQSHWIWYCGGRVWLWVLNSNLLLMWASMRGCFSWMWLWCFPCIWSVGSIISTSQTRPTSVCRRVTRVIPAEKVLCPGWLSLYQCRVIWGECCLEHLSVDGYLELLQWWDRE